jgi:hypothetical protein
LLVAADDVPCAEGPAAAAAAAASPHLLLLLLLLLLRVCQLVHQPHVLPCRCVHHVQPDDWVGQQQVGLQLAAAVDVQAQHAAAACTHVQGRLQGLLGARAGLWHCSGNAGWLLLVWLMLVWLLQGRRGRRLAHPAPAMAAAAAAAADPAAVHGAAGLLLLLLLLWQRCVHGYWFLCSGDRRSSAGS